MVQGRWRERTTCERRLAHLYVHCQSLSRSHLLATRWRGWVVAARQQRHEAQFQQQEEDFVARIEAQEVSRTIPVPKAFGVCSIIR